MLLLLLYFSPVVVFVRRRQWHPTPVLLPGKPHGQRSLVGCSHFTFTFHLHALEKEMAPQSSVFAWRIPGTREPGGLPSMGSHRVGHDWSDLAAAWITQRTKIICNPKELVFLTILFIKCLHLLIFFFLTWRFCFLFSVDYGHCCQQKLLCLFQVL